MQLARLAPKLFADLDALKPVVHDALSHLRPSSTKRYNIKSIESRLRVALKPFNIRFMSSPEPDCRISDDTWFVMMGGTCEFHWPPTIKIDMGYHPSSSRWPLSATRIRQLHCCLWRILSHELIHRHQFLHRVHADTDVVAASRVFATTADEKPLITDQKYHGEYDEIEAYAHDVVQEFYQRWPGAVNMSPYRLRSLVQQQFMLADDRELKTRFRSLWFYRSVFYGDATHPAVKTLFNKVYGWAAYGQPLGNYLPTDFA
jgi:hypothetical protein